jgi:hypothetical protein
MTGKAGLTVIVGYNTLDRSTWVRHDNIPLLKVLSENFGQSLPPTTRLFHNQVDEDHVLKFETEEDCHKLLDLTGELYVLVYPASPANLFLTSALLLTSVILQAVFPEDKKDPGRPPRTGSPSTALGNRTNRARPLARIPDYFGINRITPDLVAKPFTIYDAQHREVEINQMVLGRGSYFTTDALIYEGDSLAKNIEGLSVEVYSPGSLPTFGTPDVQVGAPINEPVRNVYRVEAVNGLRLAPLNERTLHGTVLQHPFTREFDEALSGSEFAAMAFAYDGGGVGRIMIPTTGAVTELTEITDKISVGDFLECRFDPGGATSANKGSFDRNDRSNILSRDNTFGSPPNLSDDNLRYQVTSIFPTAVIADGVAYCELTVAVPPAKQGEWAAIATWLIGPSNVLFNVSVLLTPIQKASGNFVNEHGAFFIDDPDMTSIVCNFVAERGLFMDDGKNAAALNPKIAVFVAPADENGVAIGAFQRFEFAMSGSATDTSTRALTATIDAAAGLAITGRSLISVIREDFGLWRVEDQGQGKLPIQLSTGFPGRNALVPVGGAYPPSIWNPAATPTSGPNAAIYRPRKGTVEDQVRWTHCYSLSDPGVPAFGDTTLVMTKTVASKAANVRNERKLSITATRMIGFWNGTTFAGPIVANRLAQDIFFQILKDPLLGGVPNAQIDFPGIAAAFQEVGAYFGDFEMARFDGCFDSENETLEDMLDKVARSCFCVAYREGHVIKVKPDIATDNAVVLFNHRNMIDKSETRVATFGPEADWNGARIDYQDIKQNTVKSLTVPTTNATKPRELSVAGIQNAVKAGVHAWRGYNRILFKRMDTEFQAAAEASLAVIHDKIMVADQTQTFGTQDGEIRAVSGTTITTTQPVDISSGGPYTVFLQHVDGSVEAIGVLSSPNAGQLVLASAPSQPLVTDSAAGIRTTYLLQAATKTKPDAFRVTEKTAAGIGKWNIKATNYSHGYYHADALHTWVEPGVSQLRDLSPYKRTMTLVGSPGTTGDVTRGTVFNGLGPGNYIDVTPSAVSTSPVDTYDSYTKTVWLNIASAGDVFDIASMEGGSSFEERFGVLTGTLGVMHAGVILLVEPWPVGGWHLAGLTFDQPAGRLRMFIDGELVTSTSGLSALPARSILRVLHGVGLADDLRLYRRPLSDVEHRELYQKTRM